MLALHWRVSVVSAALCEQLHLFPLLERLLFLARPAAPIGILFFLRLPLVFVGCEVGGTEGNSQRHGGHGVETGDMLGVEGMKGLCCSPGEANHASSSSSSTVKRVFFCYTRVGCFTNPSIVDCSMTWSSLHQTMFSRLRPRKRLQGLRAPVAGLDSQGDGRVRDMPPFLCCTLCCTEEPWTSLVFRCVPGFI